MGHETRAPRNRTVTVSEAEAAALQARLFRLGGRVEREDIENRIINQDMCTALDWLPAAFVDLLFLDPPYNLPKAFNATTFRNRSAAEYAAWLDSWFGRVMRTLKPTASVYICGDWRSSAALQLIADKYLRVRNRIT